MRELTHLWKTGIAALALVAVSACSPTFRNHGYVPPEEDLANIVVGVDTRATVEDVVGTPSSTGVLDDAGFFYVRSQVRIIGPRRPREVNREVVAISFDDSGVVQNIERFGLEDGRVVVLSRRVTETGIRNRNILRQIFGNLGRFNPGQFLGGGN